MSDSDEVPHENVDQPQEDTISLVFDRQKQLATLGHGLSNPKFFAKLARVIRPEYFSDPLVSKVWMAAMDIWSNHHRAPIGSEIPQWSGFAEQDSRNKARINDTILLAAKESGFYGLDLLQVEMEDWVTAVLYVKAVKKSADIYRSKQKGAVDKALKTLESGLASIKSSSFRDGIEIGFKPASERIITEKAIRMEQAPRILSYGVQFLDDTLIGIIPNDLIILGASTGLGKCLGLGTPVLKYDGTIVAVEDIKTGDQLMGPDSKPRTVLSTTRGTGPLYRINPVKGESWVCNDVHVLTLKDTVTGDIVDIPLNEYLNKNRTFKHRAKQFGVGVEFSPQVEELPIDPYFLGVWYGDGAKSLTKYDTIAGIKITKPDDEIRKLCSTTAHEWGLFVNTSSELDGKCPTFSLTSARKGGDHLRNGLLNVLRGVVGKVLNLPKKYITSSRENRLQFLAGLLDTDGYLHEGNFEIVQARKGIADDIAFLARSLGFKVTRAIKVVNGVEYYRSYIIGDFSVVPTRIKRKQAASRLINKDPLRTGFTPEAIGVGEYAGFELDGDGRFLLGDFTVTHNTAICTGIALANSLKGKRVHYFALEAEEAEIERRIKYGKLATAFYKDPNRKNGYLGYPEWRMGRSEHLIAELEHSMADQFRSAVGGLQTLYKTSGHFNLENLERHLYEIIDETDLIIIDHLHYVDVDDADENRGYRDIIMKIRDIVLNYSVPVIVVAHLRKVNGGRGPRRIIPEIEDFHGTSNISKVCTTAIMLGPAHDQPASNPLMYLHPTYCQAVKDRLDGSRTRYPGLMEFNGRSQLYEQKYKLGRAVDGGTEWEELRDLPQWANVNAMTKAL